jgi:hypothetical protein
MRESLQRLFMMSTPEVLPLKAQAERGPAQEPERSQFSHLVRHFLARFFNHETASPDGDAKTRLVLIAVCNRPYLMARVAKDSSKTRRVNSNATGRLTRGPSKDVIARLSPRAGGSGLWSPPGDGWSSLGIRLYGTGPHSRDHDMMPR